jgi:hypothetical protein
VRSISTGRLSVFAFLSGEGTCGRSGGGQPGRLVDAGQHHAPADLARSDGVHPAIPDLGRVCGGRPALLAGAEGLRGGEADGREESDEPQARGG